MALRTLASQDMHQERDLQFSQVLGRTCPFPLYGENGTCETCPNKAQFFQAQHGSTKRKKPVAEHRLNASE